MSGSDYVLGNYGPATKAAHGASAVDEIFNEGQDLITIHANDLIMGQAVGDTGAIAAQMDQSRSLLNSCANLPAAVIFTPYLLVL